MNEIILSNTRPPIFSECGLLAATEPFYHMDRTADFNVMIYVTDGAIYVTEDETDYEINPGELLFLKSGLRHWGKREIKKGTRWYYFHFYDNPDNTPDKSLERTAVLPKTLSGLKNSRFERLTKEYADDIYSHDVMKQWTASARLFDILTEVAFRNSGEKESPKLSDKICAYLSGHYSDPYSSAVLEREFFLSYKYMAAVFKRDKGMTMQQYHTNARVQAACRLLRSTCMSVSDVAAAVGCGDALYFSRRFRSVIGLCPSAYRKSVLEGG